MSKYYKVEDIERILKELSEEPNYLHPEEDWLDGICMVETRVESLPTIEVGEDCISREDAIKIIKKIHNYADREGSLRELETTPSVVPKTQIETQNSNKNSNEDAISREYIVKKLKSSKEFYLSAWEGFSNMDDKDKARCDELDYCIATVINAPSVVPTQTNTNQRVESVERAEGEWIPCTKEGLALTELMRKEGKKWYGYRCTNCSFIYKGNALTESRYCQGCGAKMKGAE